MRDEDVFFCNVIGLIFWLGLNILFIGKWFVIVNWFFSWIGKEIYYVYLFLDFLNIVDFV